MIYTARLAPYREGLSRLSYDHTSLSCANPDCDGPIHRLLTVPGQDIGRPGKNYSVVRCLNCMHWGPYFAEFDEANEPVRIHAPQSGQCQHFLEHGAWPQLAASLIWVPGPPPPEYDGSATYAGGEPDWLQDEEDAICPECKGRMEFVLQLSSMTMDGWRDELGAPIGYNRWPQELGYAFEMRIEHYATLYLFDCEACRITCSITQET